MENPTEHSRNVYKILDLLATGRIQPRVDRIFSFLDYVKAFELFENNQGRGNTVISFMDNDDNKMNTLEGNGEQVHQTTNSGGYGHGIFTYSIKSLNDDNNPNIMNDDDVENSNLVSTSLLAKSLSTNKEAFPQGCQFSPDGYCILTATSNSLELYNTPLDDKASQAPSSTSWDPVLKYETGDTVRSYTWYPHMKSSDPASCCFIGVSRDSPVHLYDAYAGTIRATYCPYNRLDEMESPTAVCFVENGQRLLLGGFRSDRMLQVFDVNRPGRYAVSTLKLGKSRRSKDGQKGLVSSLAYSQPNGVVAVGTYSPGSIYLYDLRTHTNSPDGQIIMMNDAGNCIAGHGKSHRRKRKHFTTDDENGDDSMMIDFSAAKIQWYQNRTRSGVTQMEFHGDDGQYLFSTSRRSNTIVQWDLRKLSESSYCPGIANYDVPNETNQRIGFGLHQNKLWTGGTDKCIRTYNLKDQSLVQKIDGFSDCVNDVSLFGDGTRNPSMMAVSIGTRHFPTIDDWDQDDPYNNGRHHKDSVSTAVIRSKL
jgi:hypothetical protein